MTNATTTQRRLPNACVPRSLMIKYLDAICNQSTLLTLYIHSIPINFSTRLHREKEGKGQRVLIKTMNVLSTHLVINKLIFLLHCVTVMCFVV